MMTLAEHYTELGNDTKRWSYYAKDKVDFLDILKDEHKSIELFCIKTRHSTYRGKRYEKVYL
ncbi:MAG: hypothetical protein PHT84_00045 [Candidatus Pacebacteria bacterium]|nr:hypothetical protein [Candidatus Paceibacterota bacterium]